MSFGKVLSSITTAADAGAGIGADDMEDIDRVAVAGIEIGDERDLHLLDDRAGHVEMLV